ncbi:PQQ-dependent sugar dehydrogenase [Sorangium sp. So ce1036]|uniref:PQQ-dependent sugar dehydrogenase n=1 Tax=Sorangium sp. So ce1036 TaxID=3133328 RepID=UPI003F51CE32
MRVHRTVASSLLCLLPAALAGCSPRTKSPPIARPGPGCTLVEDGAGAPGAVAVKAETVVTGLEVPWGIAFLPGGDFLVTERPGRIRLVSKGQLVERPVATIATHEGGEGGLLGIVAHPRFEENRFIYVYVTAERDGERSNRVLRYRVADDLRGATFDRVILDGIPGAARHDGGRLRFGPDGMLYIGTGDAAEPDTAQSMDSLAGKLLRLTPEGEIPADNPFPGKAAVLLGIRNTQGFDWLGSGELVVTDHGPSGDLGRRGHDEVNVVSLGANLGWPTIYGCEAREGLVTPLLTWDDAVPPGGAAIYTGSAIPEWRGSLIVGTLGSEHLHRVAFEPGKPPRIEAHEVYFEGDPPEGYGRLREVIMGPDGALYVTTSNCDGRGDCPDDKDRILRITR